MENRSKMPSSDKNSMAQKNAKPSKKNKSAAQQAAKPKAKSASALTTKKDSYSVFSKSNILTEVRNTATSSLTNMKRSFASLTTLLKPSGQTKANSNSYAQISNLPTPVKLYSPFSIETPTRVEDDAKARLQREQLVLTPKTREDLENLEYGLNELNHLTSQIEKSRARKSIFADENDLLS